MSLEFLADFASALRCMSSPSVFTKHFDIALFKYNLFQISHACEAYFNFMLCVVHFFSFSDVPER